MCNDVRKYVCRNCICMGKTGRCTCYVTSGQRILGVQHGVANSILLPVIVEYNALADHGRYEKIYNYISEDKEPVKDFKPEMLVAEIKKLNASLGIPKTLSEVGVTEDKIPQMAVDAMKSGNIAANPRQTTLKDVEMLYRKAL